MSGIVNNNPVILVEMSDDFDRGVSMPGKISVAVDPASNVVATHSMAGIKLMAPITVIPPTTNVIDWDKFTGIVSVVDGVSDDVPIGPGKLGDILGYDVKGTPVYQDVKDFLASNLGNVTTNDLSYDAIGNIITSTVNGVSSSINISELDNEGVKIVVVKGEIQLLSEDGTILSSTPVTDIDAQQLTVSPAGSTPATLSISNGNSVPLSSIVTCTTIDDNYSSGAVPSSTKDKLIAVGCKTIGVKPLVSAFGTPIANVLM